MDKPRISIVITTYNRAELLADAIAAIVDQKGVAAAEYEVIVIDNKSTDETFTVVEKFSKICSNVRYVFEPEQGSSYARNRGFHEARADWVAYLDDDAVAHNDYVARLLHLSRAFDFDCFGGVYLAWYRDGRTKWYRDEYGSNLWLQKDTGYLPAGKYFGAGNCCFHKVVLETMGGFDVALGPIGENFSYGEETHLQKRIREKGYKIGFDPYLQIDHYVAPYKQHMAWFFKSAYQHGYSSWLVYERKVTLGYLLLNLAAIILIPLVYLPKNFYRLVVGREYYWQNFFIDTFRRSSSAFGRIVAGIGNFRSINANVNRIER